jgi:hypothetical protein
MAVECEPKVCRARSVYESLKWFEGETQKRSIGIAVVEAGWKRGREFRPMWTRVLANQAIYLLVEQTQQGHPEGTAHERHNLARIMTFLIEHKCSLDPAQRRALGTAVANNKTASTRGRGIPNMEDHAKWEEAFPQGD